jgi:uncharacterized protein YjiS (DUF1127 family)
MATISRRPIRSLDFTTLVATVALRGVDAVLLWQERARQRHMLAMMDDHLLRDIGLDRSAARVEAEKPFWRV